MERRDRVVALVDMDCFYAQVEQKLQPNLWGKPVAVVQYSNIRGGGILAVSYEARKRGVKRFHRGDQAKEICPEITLCEVPRCEHSAKADLSRYRDASEEVFRCLNSYDSRITVERASIDEAFLDLTELVNFVIDTEQPALRYSASLDAFPTTHIAGSEDISPVEGTSGWNYDREKVLHQWITEACKQRRSSIYNLKLAVAAEIVEQMRQRLKEETKFHCSAGIGSNKMIAKLVCSRHKPGQQTVIPEGAIATVFQRTPISSVRHFGGKLGKSLAEKFAINTMSELAGVPFDALKASFPGQAQWIQNVANGTDDEPVRARDKQSSIAVSKLFLGTAALTKVSDVKCWVEGLAKELAKRLAEDQLKNGRTACTLHVACMADSPVGKSCPLVSYSSDALYNSAWAILKHFNNSTSADEWKPALTSVTLTAARFRDGIDVSSRRITEWVCDTACTFTPQQTTFSISNTSSCEIENLDETLVGEENIGEKAAQSEQLRLEAPSTSHRTHEDETAGARASSESFLPKSFQDISPEFLSDIPEDIQKELQDYYRQKTTVSGGVSARRSQQSSSSPMKKKRATGKRVPKAPPKAAEPEPKKKISDYFKKPS